MVVGWALRHAKVGFIWDAPRLVPQKPARAALAKALNDCPAMLDHELRMVEIVYLSMPAFCVEHVEVKGIVVRLPRLQSAVGIAHLRVLDLHHSAPSQASASAQDGPASDWVKSTVRTPASRSNGGCCPAWRLAP